MKKVLYTIGILALALLVICGVYILINHLKKTNTVGEFSLSDYSYYIEKYPSDVYFGSVDSAKMAKEKAEMLWIEKYGDSIKKEKRPYMVMFDNQNQVWLVEGTLKKNWDGGVPHILIRKSDGKVLSVWHDK